MTLDKAIEMLGFVIRDKRYTNGEPGYDALKLGIEALRRQKDWKARVSAHVYVPLPGETKD